MNNGYLASKEQPLIASQGVKLINSQGVIKKLANALKGLMGPKEIKIYEAKR